jgi:hypothetical protein
VTQFDYKSIQILIVEDSLTQAVKLQYLLEEEGIQTVVARNGLDALTLLQTTRPHLIISDIIMPEMDGYELCRRLKSDASLKNIPIILLTALSDPHDVIKAMENGADNFVTKPYTKTFLLSRVQHILINQQLRRTPGPGANIEVYFANRRYSLPPEPTQMVDLLLSTFENAVQKNLELQEANQQLLQMQQELKQKNLQMEKLNAQKDYFLGMAAHDLRNPLGYIITVSDLLDGDLAEVMNAEQRELLGLIHSSSQFMLQMVTELLDIAKIESGKLDLQLQPVNLTTLIERNLTVNRKAAEKKQIALKFERDFSPPELMLDPNKIGQVLDNLVGNAVKFSYPETTITIKLSQNSGRVIIAVQDQGQGIPAEELPLLFEPFKKLSVQGTAGEKSTGLGLAIVRKIILGHGGDIKVKSEVGRGTIFYVILPMAGQEKA